MYSVHGKNPKNEIPFLAQTQNENNQPHLSQTIQCSSYIGKLVMLGFQGSECK